MRHKYETRGIILARAPVGESSTFLTILTPEIGLVRALAQSARRSGAKLGPSLATFAESNLVLVRGRESWRVSGAVLHKNWFLQMNNDARQRSSRVTGLFLRLVVGEVHDSKLFSIMKGFFTALTGLTKEKHEAAEILIVLRILAVLGLDTGGIPGAVSEYTPSVLSDVINKRANYVARINRGITASGL